MNDLAATVVRTAERQLGRSEMVATDRLIEDLEADSFDVMNLAAVLEEQLDIEIEEEHLAQISTVGDLIALVESLAAR